MTTMKTNIEQQYSTFMTDVSNNNLNPNVTRTSEMILDMRTKQNLKRPITINNSSVDIVSSCKYLGVIIQDNYLMEQAYRNTN